MSQAKASKILVNVGEAGDILSIGRSKLLELTYTGAIPSIKIGRRRLYRLDGLFDWARNQPSASEHMEEFHADVETALEVDRNERDRLWPEVDAMIRNDLAGGDNEYLRSE